MVRRMFERFVLGAMALSGLASLGGCNDDRWTDYSYKMTVYVGDKAYSTVRHVKIEEGSSIQDSSGRRVDRRTEGEAVIIDTASGPVFALMVPADGQFGNGFYGAYVAEPALVPAIGKPQESDVDLTIQEYREEQPGFDLLADDAETHNAMLEVEGPRSLPRSIAGALSGNGPTRMTVWPMFVRFADINNPKTVEKVLPESIGVTNITIEVTDEYVTTGIEKRLRWLRELQARGGALNGERFPATNDLKSNLGSGAFWIGE